MVGSSVMKGVSLGDHSCISTKHEEKSMLLSRFNPYGTFIRRKFLWQAAGCGEWLFLAVLEAVVKHYWTTLHEFPHVPIQVDKPLLACITLQQGGCTQEGMGQPKSPQQLSQGHLHSLQSLWRRSPSAAGSPCRPSQPPLSLSHQSSCGSCSGWHLTPTPGGSWTESSSGAGWRPGCRNSEREGDREVSLLYMSWLPCTGHSYWKDSGWQNLELMSKREFPHFIEWRLLHTWHTFKGVQQEYLIQVLWKSKDGHKSMGCALPGPKSLEHKFVWAWIPPQDGQLWAIV